MIVLMVFLLTQKTYNFCLNLSYIFYPPPLHFGTYILDRPRKLIKKPDIKPSLVEIIRSYEAGSKSS